MAKKTQHVAGIAGSTLLLIAGGVGGTAVAQAQPTASHDAPATIEAQVEQASRATQKSAVVNGSLSWTQTEVTPAPQIAARMGDAAKHLCGSSWTPQSGEAACDSWTIAVTGDVKREVVATMGELAEEGSYHAIMGCSCAGNPADGIASVNAEVAGITVAYLLETSEASLDANTVVFVSDDGYEVALPLAYVAQRASMIVYDINGAELTDTIGGANQLWLGSTSARYFVRNVVEVRVETRAAAEVPPIPGTAQAGDTYANVPNIGVVFGGEA